MQQNAYNNPMPGDPHQTWWNTPVYNDNLVTGVNPLNLPLQGGANPHDIIELPPGGTDPIPNERLYNKAGLRIKVTNSGVTVEDSSGNPVSGITIGSDTSKIISTNSTLFNYRENKTVTITELRINRLIAAGKMPANGVIYVADTRTAPQQTAVRLVNGATLPSQGLTVASQNPVYIQGNYNSTHDYPAAVYGDAINILSGSWNDANSGRQLSSRVAHNTTVNAALFTGIVQTSGANYSGGVENLLRLLEGW